MNPIKRPIWLFLLFLLFLPWGCNTEALGCPIENSDLTGPLKSLQGVELLGSTELVDPDSREPIRRYLLLLEGGSAAVVQQKNCQMYNLSVTLLLSAEGPTDVSRVMTRLVSATPIWTKWFGDTELEPVLARALGSERFETASAGVVTQSLDRDVSASDESSEFLLSAVALDRDLMPYDRVVAVTIAVGGM